MPEKSKPDLGSAIAALLGELERVRKELVVVEKTWSETRAKIEALRRIANEKFRLQMAEHNATLNSRRRPEGLPMPDLRDIPEEREAEQLTERLGCIRSPVIDPQARMMFLWLSPDPLAKVVLDELDNLLRKPSLENVNSMIALLAIFPGAVVPLKMPCDGSNAALNGASDENAQDSPPIGDAQFQKEHSDGDDDDERRAALRATRQAVVMPILESKRWKPGRLATEAGVGKNSVYEYLDGTRRKITEENRQAIAQALDLKVQELPD